MYTRKKIEDRRNVLEEPTIHKKEDNSNTPGKEKKITATSQETRTQKHEQQSRKKTKAMW